MTPEDLKYYKEHEWVKMEDGTVIVGITDYAQDQLGDVVYLDVPQAGQEIEAGTVVGEVESVKSTSELYTPVSGKVVEINQEAVDKPEIVNDDPYGKGWLYKVELAGEGEVDGLMSAEDYDKYVEGL